MKQISNENSRYNLKYLNEISERCLDTINIHYKNHRSNKKHSSYQNHLFYDLNPDLYSINNITKVDRVGRLKTGQRTSRVSGYQHSQLNQHTVRKKPRS